MNPADVDPPQHVAAGSGQAPVHHGADVGSAPAVEPMSGRRLFVIGGLAAAGLALLLVVTMVPRHSVDTELRAEATARDSAPAVQVTTVKRAPAGTELVLPGTIQALHESAIYARVTGYVKRWNADIGSIVHTGQLLAEIDAPELSQSAEQAQAQLTQTHAALGLAKADLDRWRVLARDSAVTGQELDQKRAAFDAAQANTGAADANLRRLVQTRQWTRVTAPFTGVITARNIDIGSLITPAGGTSAPIGANGVGGAAAAGSMFRIAQTDTVRIYLTVPEGYATSIRTGLDAQVSAQGIPGRVFPGRVVRTSNALDATSRTLLTEIDVPNRDFALLPGMSVQATLHFPRTAPPLLLPASALVIRSNGVQVMVVENAPGSAAGTIHFRSVRLGRDYGGTVEVADGLIDGATVVLNPNADLVDGTRVRIVSGAAEQQAPSATGSK
ncbi:MAG: efflux RND transporter periplasmic adaptor subunit [Gemmatimonadota bacterium]|nr:efflux RND transporter periplasmic adaptor subunit [Gemmatimonadota bacterium]